MKVQIAANAVVAKVVNADESMKLELGELLSYAIAGAEHTAAYQNHDWSGRSTLFSYEKGSFPAGLVSLVAGHLQQQGHQVAMLRQPAPEPLGKPFPRVNEFEPQEKYSYQYETVEQLVRHRQIIAQIATGGGKSNVAQIALAWIGRPTLFLTTRSVLMHQMKRGFEKSLKWRARNGEAHLGSVKVGVMGDGEFAPRRLVNVAMVQTIQAKLESKDPAVKASMRKLLEHFELVISEEAHEASGNGYYETLRLCKNAHYRLALTATPFMREDEEANMRLMACSGPIAIRVTEKELIDKGILARPIFKYLTPTMPPSVSRTSNWQRAYLYGIQENEFRNKMIAVEARRAVGHGLSVMILVQRREHGKLLQSLIQTAGVTVGYIFGESKQEIRDKALADLKNGTLNVLIGSTILDVGVDVPSVGMIILAGGGKAEVALRQRIGRGLRAKAPGRANIAYIVDFSDGKNKHLMSHATQRRSIVENTPGFAENILRPGQDFDFNFTDTRK